MQNPFLFPEPPSKLLGAIGVVCFPINSLDGHGVIKWFFNIIPKLAPNLNQAVNKLHFPYLARYKM